MKNLPDNVLINIYSNFTDSELIKIPNDRQSYHCSRYVLRKRMFDRGWLRAQLEDGTCSDAELAQKGIQSFKAWSTKINQIKKTYPYVLPAPQNTKKFFPKEILNNDDINDLNNFRRYKEDGTLEPLQMDQCILAKLQLATTVGDQYRYISALMHFQPTEDFLNFWEHGISPENKHDLLFGEKGGTPPILFQAILHGSWDFLQFLTQDWDANTWANESVDILNLCFRAIGFTGNLNITIIFLEKLAQWGVYQRVLSYQNESLIKAIRDCAKYGYHHLLILLLIALPTTVTTRKGVYNFKVKMLASEQEFLKELASRDAPADIWKTLARMIPNNDSESAQDFFDCAINAAITAQNLCNANILLQLAEKRNLHKLFFQKHCETILRNQSLSGNLNTLKWFIQQAQAYEPKTVGIAARKLLLPEDNSANIFAILPELDGNCTTLARIKMVEFWWGIVVNNRIVDAVVETSIKTYERRIAYMSTSRDEEFITWMGNFMAPFVVEQGNYGLPQSPALQCRQISNEYNENHQLYRRKIK